MLFALINQIAVCANKTVLLVTQNYRTNANKQTKHKDCGFTGRVTDIFDCLQCYLGLWKGFLC